MAAAQVAGYGEAGHLPAGLLRALLPGPVTVVLRRRSDAPLASELNPGIPTLGAPPPAACASHRAWSCADAASSGKAGSCPLVPMRARTHPANFCATAHCHTGQGCVLQTGYELLLQSCSALGNASSPTVCRYAEGLVVVSSACTSERSHPQQPGWTGRRH